MNKLYSDIIAKHKEMLDELEEAVILHHLTKIEPSTLDVVKNVETIIDYWCDYYKVSRKAAGGPSRVVILKTVRYCVFWTLRNKIVPNNLTSIACGKLFNRHHATALYGIKQVDNWITYDVDLRNDLMIMLSKFGYITYWDEGAKLLSWTPKDEVYL